MGGHEDAGTALLGGALAPQTVDLAVVVHAVVLKGGQGDLLVLMLDLLGGGVILLLPLLSATAKAEHQVQRGLWKPQKSGVRHGKRLGKGLDRSLALLGRDGDTTWYIGPSRSPPKATCHPQPQSVF